ncbi:MAG: hypothetical protein ACR5LF_07435 [Symbiopectobacterium sp.]
MAERVHVFCQPRYHVFCQPRYNDTVARLQALMARAPHRHWTAREAGRELVMREATLRRVLPQRKSALK